MMRSPNRVDSLPCRSRVSVTPPMGAPVQAASTLIWYAVPDPESFTTRASMLPLYGGRPYTSRPRINFTRAAIKAWPCSLLKKSVMILMSEPSPNAPTVAAFTSGGHIATAS